MIDEAALGRNSANGERTILLLEDEPLILMDLEMAAEHAGCTALVACCAAQALAHLEDGGPSPDVAVLDVTLQDGETCLPVASELERRGIPYILHSGDYDRKYGEIGALAAELVPKPARSESVIAIALGCLAADARSTLG